MGSVKQGDFHRREVTHIRLYCSRTVEDPDSWGRFHYVISKEKGIVFGIPLVEHGYSGDLAGFDTGSIDVVMVGTHLFGFNQVRNLIQLLRVLCVDYTIPFTNVLPEYSTDFGFDFSDIEIEDVRTLLRRE